MGQIAQIEPLGDLLRTARHIGFVGLGREKSLKTQRPFAFSFLSAVMDNEPFLHMDIMDIGRFH